MRLVTIAYCLAASLLGAAGCRTGGSHMKELRNKLGVDIGAMDKDTAPQDDFFRYVNGAWLDKTDIPSDKSRFGAFDILIDKAEADVQAIIKELSESEQAPGTDAHRIAAIYNSFMDETTAEAKGADPVREDLAAIDAIRDKAELVRAFARTAYNLGNAPFGAWVGQDSKNPKVYITHLSQSGLGLPDRDYYFKDDERTVKIQKKYREYLAELFTLAGIEDAAIKVKTVYAIEKALAKHHWTRVENRDSEKTYNKRSMGELKKLAPGIGWKGYFKTALVRPEETHVIVSQPNYIKAMAKVVADTPLADWKLYLKAHTLGDAAPYLSDAFVQAKFEYAARTLSGQPEMRPRWKRGTALVNGAVGELIGQIYVKRHFPKSSKKRMVDLVENLRAAYGERIRGLRWMGAKTKKKALIKLDKFTPKIGYPDKWKDYSKLTVAADDLMGNIKRSARVEYDRMIEKLGKPIDRTEWHMTPQQVNAYYNPRLNEIVFPAAILQPPFFNPLADDAVNYGAIGGVIGHEMGHGFDDQGAKFDGDGVLRDWWTPEDKEAFKKRTEMLVEQYAAYEPYPGAKVNGELTLGENIGDLGGLTVAHHAYQLSLKGKKSPVVKGFTGEQRVFLGWAQVWRTKTREEAMRQRINVDPHSPEKYRVNGVLRNMPEFYKAFGVRKEHKLFMEKGRRAAIW